MGGVYWFYLPGMCTCPQWGRSPSPLSLAPTKSQGGTPPVVDRSNLCGFCKAQGAHYWPPELKPSAAEREQVVNEDARAMLRAGTPEPEAVKSDFTEDE